AVIATTIALAAVFMPLLFLSGLTGRLFREFGVVLAGCVIVSSFVALTLTPMLSTRLLSKRGGQHGWFYRVTGPFFVRSAQSYQACLRHFLRVRWTVVPAVLACLAITIHWVRTLPTELAPLEDRSSLRINASAPEGTSYEVMGAVMDKIDGVLKTSVPEVAEAFTITSPGFGSASTINSGFVRVTLVNAADRERSQQQIAADL